jgi:hypothetical protein
MMKLTFKQIVVVLINLLLLYFSVKAVYQYYIEQDLVKNDTPIECIVLSKKCKYSRATSHCIVSYNSKHYSVPIEECDNLETGKNNSDFYYHSFTDKVLFIRMIHLLNVSF